MDSRNNKNSNKKSRSQQSGGSRPHSRESHREGPSHSRPPMNKNHNSKKGKNQRASKKHNQKSKFHYKRHHSKRCYPSEEHDYKRNNESKSNWNHYNYDWSQSSVPRFGNRTWQRNTRTSNEPNHKFQSTLYQKLDFTKDYPHSSTENFIQDNFGNQQFLNRGHTGTHQNYPDDGQDWIAEYPEQRIDFEVSQEEEGETQNQGFSIEESDARTEQSRRHQNKQLFQAQDRNPLNVEKYPNSEQANLNQIQERPSQRTKVPIETVLYSEYFVKPQNDLKDQESQYTLQEQNHHYSNFENDNQLQQPFDQNALHGELSYNDTTTEIGNRLEQSELEAPETFVRPEPAFLSDEQLFLNLKHELPEATDSELENCLNVDIDNHFPSISIIPISRLIKSELQDLHRTDIIAPTTPSRGRPTLRPNLVKRRKKSINDDSSGSLSENLVQRVANMDKVGIKNVINNSGTKYDAALKIQARKRLREEIRQQLKSMNFKPPENSENSVIVPDEIVDSMNIPAVLLDEIRKAFGIVLVEDIKVIPETEMNNVQAPQETTAQSTSPTKSPVPSIDFDATAPKSNKTSTQSAKEQSKSPDLMSRIKMLEEVKSQTEKLSPIRKEVLPPKQQSKSKTISDVVVINSSSSSSSSSSSGSDSDTSSTSSNSNTSSTSSYKRRRRKKRILEANVVGNFEKLILPNLTPAQRKRYKEKYSKTTKSSLQYIYGVCVSRANQNKNSVDPKEKLKLKRNLSSADNAQALEFLMKAILDLFEQQKEKRKKSKSTPTITSASKSQSGSKGSNPVSTTKKLENSTCHNEKSVTDKIEEPNKSANSTKEDNLLKHQSKTDESLQSVPSPEGAVNRNAEDSIPESAKSAQGVSANERLVAQDTDSDSDGDNTTQLNSPPSRMWKSPGEKKCIEMESSFSMGNLGVMQPPLGMLSLDLDSLKSQSSLGDEAVSNIREIDVKLMELHKRKMYIEEMILKLQKDKMEVDLWTMKLQNEKFILLNSALTNVSNTSSATLPPKLEKKAKPTMKRKPFSTPFSEKLRNRKKRCQQDILLEDTEKAINANKPDGEVSDISKLMLQPRQTRRGSTRTKVKAEETSTKETSKTDPKAKPKETTLEDQTSESIMEKLPKTDYTNVPNGYFEGWKQPITQIIVLGEAVIAASEDGNIYKFNIRTHDLMSKFSKHTEAITQIYACAKEYFVYTTSLDGFMKKTSVENFGLEIHSLNLQEPLQSLDIEWGTAFIGSRWGNIFTFDIKNNTLSESLLCSAGSSIIAIKATKEGPRKILIVSSKGNLINFRDATTGLLLRSLDVPESLHIYSILLDGGSVFCGTQRNEIFQYSFTTGGRMATFRCGNGAVSMKLYKDKYIFVGCYDGFVYVLDKTTGCQIGRFPGSGKMILALEVAGDKLITSAKDNTMQLIDIPKYIVTKDKS